MSIYVVSVLPHMEIHLQGPLQAVACLVRIQNRWVTFCSLCLPPNDNPSFQDLSHLTQQLPEPFIICTMLTVNAIYGAQDNVIEKNRFGWMSSVITTYML